MLLIDAALSQAVVRHVAPLLAPAAAMISPIPGAGTSIAAIVLPFVFRLQVDAPISPEA